MTAFRQCAHIRLSQDLRRNFAQYRFLSWMQAVSSPLGRGLVADHDRTWTSMAPDTIGETAGKDTQYLAGDERPSHWASDGRSW